MNWVRPIAAFVAALVVGLLLDRRARRPRRVGDDSPEQLNSTYGTLSLVCLVRPLCPVSSDALAEMKGALAGRSDAEYGLALMLLTGDGPAERSRRAESPGWRAPPNTASPARRATSPIVCATAKTSRSTSGRSASALQKRVDAGDAEAMRALGPMIVRGRGVKQDPAAGVALMRRAFDLGATGAAAISPMSTFSARPACRRIAASISIGCRRGRGAAIQKRCCRSATPR